MPDKYNDLVRKMLEVDRVVHEPARLMILTILYTVDAADFIYLQNETGLTKGNLSSHLTKLEEAQYISIEKTYRGKIPLTLCRLTETGKAALEEYRSQLKNYMEKTL